ncbi:hypothetical protein D3C73_867680 [compost metagenome]
MTENRPLCISKKQIAERRINCIFDQIVNGTLINIESNRTFPVSFPVCKRIGANERHDVVLNVTRFVDGQLSRANPLIKAFISLERTNPLIIGA